MLNIVISIIIIFLLVKVVFNPSIFKENNSIFIYYTPPFDRTRRNHIIIKL